MPLESHWNIVYDSELCDSCLLVRTVDAGTTSVPCVST
jgi:hypothetical protein